MTVNGDARTFLFYRGGILSSENCKPELSHAVTGVGYGTDENTG